MKKLAPFLLLWALPIMGLRAQDTSQEDAYRALLEKAVKLNIVARLLPPDEQPVWDMKSSNVTIPGRSIAVKLVGQNLRIHVVFTPYQQEDGRLLLLAQGQVWLMKAPQNETSYVSTVDSIPVSMGEKIFFYPLGLSREVPQQQSLTIQLEIEVLPYRALEDEELGEQTDSGSEEPPGPDL